MSAITSAKWHIIISTTYFQSGDHVYTMKKREAKSPGPTIHEIHSSDMMNDVIIDSPDIEVSDDAASLL